MSGTRIARPIWQLLASSRNRYFRIFISLGMLFALEMAYSPGFYLCDAISVWIYQVHGRPDVCGGCFNHDFRYLIQNFSICQTRSNARIDLMIVIASVHNQHVRRNVLRETWLSISKRNSANIRYAFLLGASEDTTSMAMVYKESRMYGDILMESFTDSYLNLTLKTIMGVKWAARYCAHAKFFMKTDQDMWVNVPKIMEAVEMRSDKLHYSVGGHCSSSFPFRLPYSKWYTTFTSYPHIAYPEYCSGTGYVTAMAVVTEVDRIYANIPFFQWEDIYFSLCLQRLNMGVTHIPGFYTTLVELDPCTMRSDILTSHGVSSELIVKYTTASC